MVKQLEFSEEKVFKALLNKTKTTTLRRTWKPFCLSRRIECEKSLNIPCELRAIIEKPCKFKVGEKIELIWTGKLIPIAGKVIKKGEAMFIGEGSVFGRAKITKIEKVKIQYLNKEKYYIGDEDDMPYFKKDFDYLAKSEGFLSVEEMFSFLEKYSGGLKEPREFWLVRFLWL